MSVYGRVKAVYRRIVPGSLRQYAGSPGSPFRRPLNWVKKQLERGARDQEIYDRDYFQGPIEQMMTNSAPVMAESIVERFHPGTVVDVGCGTGALLEQLRRRGISCTGLENADAAIAIARERGLTIIKFDLEQTTGVPLTSDLVISTEVAEHLPARFADPFVDRLCSISEVVLMTAATPGQGGTDHVNEQPNAYWIEKFAARGYEHQVELSESVRQEWQSRRVTEFYWRNLMVFRRA